MSNVITVVLSEGCTSLSATKPAYQYDYGQVLKITGIDLPTAYQVHFSNNKSSGDSITMIGNADGVLIPDEVLATGSDVYAFLFLQTGESDGETEYRITIPVHPRPAITDYEPTPAQQGAIDQLISALNDGVEAAEQSATSADESAQAASNSATAASQSASNAQQSASEAAQSAADAATSETNAQTSANAAAASAQASAQSASESATSASEAQTSADRAEQAAATSGYLWFYIENGKLYMDRTPNTQVDFYMQNGKLYVRETA